MQLAWFVRRLGHLLLLGLAGFGGGCDPKSSDSINQGNDTQIRESKKQTHRQVKEDAQKTREDLKTQSTQKRAAHRGPAGS